MAIQCYFADVDSERPIALGEWVHVVHTYRRNDSRIYIDGVLAGAATPLLDIPAKVRLHIGGWQPAATPPPPAVLHSGAEGDGGGADAHGSPGVDWIATAPAAGALLRPT